MSTTQVSVTDLNRVVTAIAATQAAVQQITARTNQISNQVEAVDNRVAAVNRDLVALAKDFTAFVKEQRNANNFQRAITEIVRVRQELDQKFGKHAEARKRLQGILDTVDTGLLREFTIASCSEQIMLDTPKYWLSPCLVALAAWISNNDDLAKRAVKVALDRDVEEPLCFWRWFAEEPFPQILHRSMQNVPRTKSCPMPRLPRFLAFARSVRSPALTGCPITLFARIP